MKFACVSDIGLYRDKNQDAYITVENKFGDFLAIVADGIGGGKAGEVASNEVVKYFNVIFKESGPFDNVDDAINYLNYHLARVNEKIFSLSLSDRRYSGMGTTITGLLIHSNFNISFNCGDSRVYGFADSNIYHLTSDHTLVNQMLESNKITYEESLNHPKRHYLVKAIGIFQTVIPDVHKVKDMDYYLICSDGLHGYVSDEEITNIVISDSSLEEKIEDLKDISLMKGGYDNITAILIEK